MLKQPTDRCRLSSTTLALLALCGVPALACGPFFAAQLLSNGDRALLRAPPADFDWEITKLKPTGPPGVKAVPPDEKSDVFAQTDVTDLAELREVLVAQPKQEELLREYAAIRKKLRVQAQAASTEKGKAIEKQQPEGPPLRLPEGLPAEFALYLRGAIVYHQRQPADARAAWNELLRLPAAERRHRTVWAAFMIGKSLLDFEPEQAVGWFRKARQWAGEGFSDRLGLAAASLGWEAKAELNRRNFVLAINLYLAQAAVGDETAYASLRRSAELIFKAKDLRLLDQAAQDRAAAEVLTAFLIARGGPTVGRSLRPDREHVFAWLAAVERAKPIQIAGVEKLAWAAYQCGEMTTAERWLKRADSDQPTAKWLAAKLLLYDGKLAEAAPLLAQVSRMFPEEEVWKNVERNDFQDGYGDFKPHAEALGECGVLHFARREYTQALRCLLSAGYWTDAAYIAERVLTTDELKSYVDCSCPATNETQTKIGKTACSEKNESSQFEPQTALRGLLARRLVRMGRRAEAKVYFSNDLQNRLAFYAQALQEGNDANKSRADRADALWRAALIARYDGLELLGTELAPDWAVYDGDYDLGTLAETVWPVKEEPQRLFHLDPELQRRLSRHVPKPEKRFHYRHVACDHAWAATALLPDQADETARRLCLAGSWIKDREPKSADRFYKALIRRCSTTTLGQTAETLRWFPKMDDKNSTPEDDDRRITQHKSLPGLNLK